jgi:hypothetical protein
MSSIRTYEDLEAEEKRLRALLYSHKENIKDSIAAVKEGLNPFKQVAATAKRLFSRDRSNPMMRFGVDLGVDVLVRRFLLAKAGWFTKIIVPFFVKNYSSYFIKEYKKSKLLQKIMSFFKHAKENGEGTTGDTRQSASNMT